MRNFGGITNSYTFLVELNMDATEKIKAGFWIRFSAIFIDTIIVYTITSILVIIAQYFNYYIPFELTFIIIALLYSIIFLGLKNFTIGKWFCGLIVQKKGGGESIGLLKSFIREFCGKVTFILLIPYGLSAFILRNNDNGMAMTLLPILLMFLFLIILFIQFLITKRAWYDHITNTVVYQPNKSKSRNKYYVAATILFFVFFLGNAIIGFFSKYTIAGNYSAYALSKQDYIENDNKKLIDISSLDSTKNEQFTNWLNKNGKSPHDYILEKVSQYQITIFGEMHDQSNYLVMLKELLPELYHKAGVRYIAMEVCVHEDNELIDKLVTANEYDEELALEIGRHQPWLAWGGKEYWDILKAVWLLNKNLDQNQEKIKIIGLDSKWDGPSIALTRGTESGKSGPLYEKLRILRAIRSLPLFIYRDELMANEIDKEIIKKNKKGIVWVGSAHSFLNYKQQYQSKGRMAYILYKKYGDKIFQINLHSNYSSIPIAKLIERSASFSKFHQIGFDLYKSPFNELRDSSSNYFRNQSNVCYGDIVRGYIYLAPCDSLSSVKYIKNFISPRMFAREKPYYELVVGKPLFNAKEVNDYYVHYFNK